MNKVHVVSHEETVRQLKTRLHGSKSYTLVHTLTYTSDMELVPDMCPEKKRSIYDGYNVADALGFVTLESYSKVWQANLEMQRHIYGTRMVTLKDVGDQGAGAVPDKNEAQPAFYHQLPPELHLEVIHSYNVVGVLDLTAGGGQLAQSCLTKRIPYLGFGLTEAHAVELEKYLTMWVKDMMCTEGHPLCKKGAAAAKAKAVAQVAPAADKQTKTTDQDNNEKDKHDLKDKGTQTNKTHSSEESEEDEDSNKCKKKNTKNSSNTNRKQSKKRSSDESSSESF